MHTPKHCCTALSVWVKIIPTLPLGYMGGHSYDSKSAPIHHAVLLFKASPVLAHPPRAQNQPAFTSGISATFLQCTVPRRCWKVNPRLCFPGQTCLVVLFPFLCPLQAWSFQLHEPLVSLHPFILSMACGGTRGAQAGAFSLALAVVGTSSSCPALAVPLMLGSTTCAALSQQKCPREKGMNWAGVWNI